MRQAVVVIHGIGEQRPMDTLRRFIAHVAGDGYWSKPDRLSESLELRRFRLPNGAVDGVPTTDFFELYWAHRFEDGKLTSTVGWLARQAFRRPWTVVPSLRPLLVLVQALSLAIAVVAAFAVRRAWQADGLDDLFRQWQAYVAVGLAVVQLVAGRFLVGSVADAARYLTPKPKNIAARTAIRNDGIRLVRRLHECGEYERVVVVGHSLGSVIGYDVLRHAWDSLRHPRVEQAGRQPEANGFDAAAAPVRGSSAPPRSDVEKFQQAQHRLWRENRSRGVPWLVTDFVTIGSPLAHARMLLYSKTAGLPRRQREREFPTCPPAVTDRDGSTYDGRYVLHRPEGDLVRNFRVGHHGAPFGPTRWTNLYMPQRRLVLGDLVGGPVAPVFGWGVRDVPVRPAPGRWRRLRGVFPLAHLSYWRIDPKHPAVGTEERRARDRATGTKDTAVAVRSAMLLDSLRAKEPWPPATPFPEVEHSAAAVRTSGAEE